MNLQRRRRQSPRPDMVPLLDVIFHVLIFFMVFSPLSLSDKTQGVDETLQMGVELPKAVTGDGTLQPIVFEISVDKNGVFYVEGKAVTGPELRDQLQGAITANPQTFVIVKADKSVRYEYVVNALDHVRSVGGSKLGLAVEQQS